MHSISKGRLQTPRLLRALADHLVEVDSGG